MLTYRFYLTVLSILIEYNYGTGNSVRLRSIVATHARRLLNGGLGSEVVGCFTI